MLTWKYSHYQDIDCINKKNQNVWWFNEEKSCTDIIHIYYNIYKSLLNSGWHVKCCVDVIARVTGKDKEADVVETKSFHFSTILLLSFPWHRIYSRSQTLTLNIYICIYIVILLRQRSARLDVPYCSRFPHCSRNARTT